MTQLKKEYSVLSQALTTIAADNDGDISSVFAITGTQVDNANAMNVFVSKLNVLKNCGTGMGCLYDSPFKALNGNVEQAKWDTASNGIYGKAVLSDGSIIFLASYAGTCSATAGTGPLLSSVCGWIFVDVNGAKGPNMRGRDNFVFYITKSGLYPWGSYNDGATCDATQTGLVNNGCAAKVLQEGAMNYY